MQKIKELISWTQMRFKAKKSSSVKSKMVGKRFQVNGEDNPLGFGTASEESGSWYGGNLNDRHCGVRIQEQVSEWLKRIYGTLIPEKAKLSCFQFGLLPTCRVLWHPPAGI